MYGCINCGAGMRYDIESGKLVCDFCGTSCSIEDHPRQREDAKRDEYEVSVFSCPQCGGEIRSADNAATEFCTYCGASVTLQGRLSSEKKPQYIIPFSRTKENCKTKYQKITKRAWCLPKELKDASFLERFTGIYLPYWVYQVHQEARPALDGVKTSGDEKLYCHLSMDINRDYDWIPYDAASRFSDDLSKGISSYKKSHARAFTPAYLSGFYADIADVREDTYETEACDEAGLETFKAVQKAYPGMEIEAPDSLARTFGTKATGVEAALFPVWFLTWRNRNRVAYAVMNGDSGDMAADLPVSIPKFLGFSLLTAVPFALLFLLLPSIAPGTLLSISIWLSICGIWRYQRVMTSYIAGEKHLLDKGYLQALEEERGRKDARLSEKFNPERRSGLSKTVAGILAIAFVIGGGFLLLTILDYGFADTIEGVVFIVGGLLRYFAPLAGLAVSAWILLRGLSALRYSGYKSIFAETCLLACTTIAAVLIHISHPVHDYYYYLGAILALAGICLGYLCSIRRYNISCTRPLPEYHQRGGKSA